MFSVVKYLCNYLEMCSTCKQHYTKNNVGGIVLVEITMYANYEMRSAKRIVNITQCIRLSVIIRYVNAFIPSY